MRDYIVGVLVGLLFVAAYASWASRSILNMPCAVTCECANEESYTTMRAWVTAYTSSADECGNDLGITASGERARDGVVACNFLPFGTRVKIPELFGEKEFVVMDRMSKEKKNYVDVWVEEKYAARQIGKSFVNIVVIDS